jgi:hypothetical protein
VSAARVLASSLINSLRRYQRSVSLWLLLIAAPIAARYMIPMGPDAEGVRIIIGTQLPEMTSGFLGVSLGIVVSTLVLPVAWLYLRANTTRRQPWQVEEVTAASRVAIALGRFAADSVVLLAMLVVLTLSGVFLGWLIRPAGGLNVGEITFALWVIAAPALLGLAALRTFFDARPLMRGALGDVVFLVLWMTAIVVPAVAMGAERTFATNLLDFTGFASPLLVGAPAGTDSFVIGGGVVAPGRVQLDVFAGLLSPGYLESRLAWVGIAIALTVSAGLVYAPHRARRKAALSGRFDSWLSRPPRRVIANAPPAKFSIAGPISLVVAEMRLIASGWAFPVLAVIAAGVSAVLPDFRHGGSAAGLLVLAFALSAHAGRSEARQLVSLTKLAVHGPMLRRAAFVVGGTIWSVLLGLPAILHQSPVDVLTVGSATGAVAGLAAIGLSALTGSAVAARLVLLAAWYVYLSS